MKVVYPPPHHQTHEASTFLIGAVAPGQQLQVERQPVPVSASGSFAWPVALQFGKNPIQLRVLAEQQVLMEEQVLTVLRPEPLEAPFPLPLAVHPEVYAPKAPQVFRPGDWLMVSCLASPGVDAAFTVPGLIDTPVPMQEAGAEGFVENRQAIFAQLHQTDGLIPKRGFYQGAVQLPLDVGPLEAAPLQLRLKSGAEEALFSLPGATISVWTQPQGARVLSEGAVMRVSPETGARLTPQREGTLVWVDGRDGAWSRVRLAGETVGWIQTAELEGLPCRVKQPVMLLLITTHSLSPTVSLVELPLKEQVPLCVETTPDRLFVTLYGVASQCDFIHYAPEDTVVQGIHLKQVGPEQLQVEINVPGLSGFSYAYEEGAWLLTVKRLPESISETIVLLDPGHGGEETGATGPTGIPEKDLNLSLACLLKPLLEQAGFQVRMTRDVDQAVSLEERAQQVLGCEADIVLSLHHNALPDGRDPLQAQGASCYYYHAFSHHLARHLQKALVSGVGLLDYGVLYDSLAMTRIAGAVSVLVEVGFMTYPEEYDRLVDPAFQQKTAEVLAEALQVFFSKG